MIHQTDISTASAKVERDAAERSSSASDAASKFQEILRGLFDGSNTGMSAFPISHELGPKRTSPAPRNEANEPAEELPLSAHQEHVADESRHESQIVRDIQSDNDQLVLGAEGQVAKHMSTAPVISEQSKVSQRAEITVGARVDTPKPATPLNAVSTPTVTELTSELPTDMETAVETKGTPKAASTQTPPQPARADSARAQVTQLAPQPLDAQAQQPSQPAVIDSETKVGEPVKSSREVGPSTLRVHEPKHGEHDSGESSSQLPSQANGLAHGHSIAKSRTPHAQIAGQGAANGTPRNDASNIVSDPSAIRLERGGNSNHPGAPSTNVRERLTSREGTAAGKAGAANQAKFIMQIQKALDSAARSNDGNTLIVKLEELEMGAVSLKVTKRADQIFARVQSERPEVEQTLRGQVSEIVGALQSAGFKPENIHVSFGGEQSDQSWAAFRQQSSHQPKHGAGHEQSRKEFGASLSQPGNGIRNGGVGARMVDSGWVA